MEKNEEKEGEKEYTFDAICFSTNFINFSSMKIMNQYFMSADCFDINRSDENSVTFKHKLKYGNNIEIECKNSYFEISLINKTKIKKDFDCFLIFFDLEFSDSLGELNKVIKNLSNLSENDKRLYIVKFFMEEKDIKKNFKDTNITNILDKYGFNISEILEVNMNIPDELINKIDKITLDTLQSNNLFPDNLSSRVDKSESNSKCIII